MNEEKKRWGLYLLVGFGVVHSCRANLNTDEILRGLESQRRDLGQMINLLQKTKFTPTIENVIEGPGNETFYELNGQKFYLKIDGKPVESYLQKP